jgi:serine O-acetyltransferase
VAHVFWKNGHFFIARFLSHLSRFFTQIEIHPGATIGRRFFIDHGSGVVVGETAEIGDDVLIYQGVVLGGVSLKKGKRHPTIGNSVLIGSGTIILGPVRIGNGARIGAASLVISDVPENSVAVGVPARVGLGFSAKEIQELGHNKLPDPIAEAFRLFGRQIELLEERLGKVERKEGIDVELDRVVEEKKKEIMKLFSGPEQFGGGEGI